MSSRWWHLGWLAALALACTQPSAPETESLDSLIARNVSAWRKSRQLSAVRDSEGGMIGAVCETLDPVGKATAVTISPSSSAVVNMPWKKSSAAIVRALVVISAPVPSTAAG